MRIFLLPGLGANELLFKYITEALDNIIVPPWIPAQKGESLSSYGRRLAQGLDITSDDYVGGMSFGGQVALEIAKIHQVQGLLLISSQRTSEETAPSFKLQQKLAQTLPESAIRMGLKNIGISVLKSKENLKPQEIQWLSSMVDAMDMDFFKWAAQAAACWDYSFSPQDLKCPVYQIHGEHDFVIKIKDWPETQMIEGAQHLINYTHPKEVIHWLKQSTSSLS